MRRRRPVAILVVAAFGVVMAVASAWAQARLVWNYTPSIPIGLYAIEQRAWKRDDRVALKPTGTLHEALSAAEVLKDGRLLMKRVAAVAGDEVCRDKLDISINGIRRVTARNEQHLPSWSGCKRLQMGEVFLLGETDNSFDGRYFGITPASDIIGPLEALVIF